SDLLEAGGLPVLPAGPHERILRRAVGRLTHIDDSLRIEFIRRIASHWSAPPDLAALDLRGRRLFHMLATILTESIAEPGETLVDAASMLWRHPQVLLELVQLMEVLAERIDHVQPPLDTHPEVPL